MGRVIGKGNKEREFLVDMETLKYLQQYREQRGADDIPALFISKRKKRLSPRAVEHILRAWCERLGLPHVHPHALRHTASSTWHRLGMSTHQIARLLGHSSPATTERYIKPDETRLRAEYFACMDQLSPASTNDGAVPPAKHA